MGNRKWIIAAAALAVIVAGATVAGGLYVQQHPAEPSAEDRVSACVDAAMQRMDGVDDEQLVEATRVQVRESCEARVG